MHFTNEQMAVVCLVCTLVAVLPSCLHLFCNARKDVFLLSLINTSLAFFLFSFQFHEKSILLVTFPIMLYFQTDPLFVLWFLHMATFSMMPLLALDQLVFPTVILTFIYLMLIRIAILWIADNKIPSPQWDILSLSSISDNKLLIGLFYLSGLFGCMSLLFAQMFIQPPISLPFLFPLLNSAYSCVHFVMFFIYFNYRQLSSGKLVETTQRVNRKTKHNKTNVPKKEKKNL